MPTLTEPAERSDSVTSTPTSVDGELTRRGFLRVAAVAGGGLAAFGVAACAGPTPTSGWLDGPTTAPGASGGPSSPPASAAPSMSHTPAPSPAPSASPGMDHDANALAVVERFLGGEGAAVEGPGNQALEPEIVDGVKVFDMTIEEMDHRIDAHKEPVQALGFNGTWPGPRLTVMEGDRVRVTF